MNNRYSFIDPIFTNSTKTPFLFVDKNDSPLLRILRLISGTLDCVDDYTTKKYKFRTNYIDLPYAKNSRISKSILTDVFPDNVTHDDLNTYFKKTKRNMAFYLTIELEIVKCLIAQYHERHLDAFMYLYRIIEGISYSLPLIYSSKASDYKKSYQSLKSFFSSNSKDGELAFFKTFISEVYKNEDFYKSTIDVKLNCIDLENIRESYFSIYKERVASKYIFDLTEGEEIQITFIGFYGFLIELRNRYFHFLQGPWQDNLSSNEILYPDLFFKPIVDNGLNWVSILLFEILKHDLDNKN